MSFRPRILLFTGAGKGKTTAALGLVLRTAGHGMRACVIQFIKSAPTGEIQSLALLKNVRIFQMGLGFLPEPESSEYAQHRAAAEGGLDKAREAIISGSFNLVVLDEICLAVHRGLLAEECVVEAIGLARPSMILALTGRHASTKLIEIADTITDMRCVKHGMQAGYPAQKGVEL